MRRPLSAKDRDYSTEVYSSMRELVVLAVLVVARQVLLPLRPCVGVRLIILRAVKRLRCSSIERWVTGARQRSIAAVASAPGLQRELQLDVMQSKQRHQLGAFHF